MGSLSGVESGVISREITLDDITDTLSLVMSRDAAAAIVSQCLRDAQVQDIDSVTSLQEFAEQLMSRGGFVRTVGSGLRRSATLRPNAA